MPEQHGPGVIRDWIMFGVGICGVVYETVVTHVDRPALLALFAGMMGLPLFLRRDEAKSDDKPESKTDEGR